jgi:hypothetical protein
VPAIVLDLLRRRIAGWSRWAQAGVLGAVFLASFIAVQWPFADFLMSPASRNWIFATADIPYFVGPRSPWARNVFMNTEPTVTAFWTRMGIALVVAAVMTEIGTCWGNWMRKIRR